jgi:ribosomal protein S18 acetylase RimI-like enzyme
LWIDPEFRRQGYATQALRLLETEAERRGADRLGLSVRVANEGAVALYSRLGYAASNLHLWKMLRPASEP